MSNLYKSRYLDIMDSIYDMRKFDMVKNSLLNYEIYKTTKEIEDLRTSQHERMQTIRMQWVIMCAVAVVALTTILFLFIVWKQKKRIHKGYINLYKINHDFIETQELLTSRLRKCRTEISEKNDITDSLRQELGNAKDTEESTAEEGMKYQTSNLTDGQMQTIADAIGNVMENTTEFCDCNFSLSRLADLVGSNRSYVSQVINDSFQKTFNDYVTPYRPCLQAAHRQGQLRQLHDEGYSRKRGLQVVHRICQCIQEDYGHHAFYLSEDSPRQQF